MPNLVRKLVIVAAVDGLLLYPAAPKAQRPVPSLQIKYSTSEIKALEAQQDDNRGNNTTSLEAHGIIGLFSVASSPYLISISSRKQVAQIRGKPVYVITGVTLIPLSSQSDAKKAIDQMNESLKKGQDTSGERSAESGTSEDEDDHEDNIQPEHEDPTVPSTPEKTNAMSGEESGVPRRNTSVAEDVIGKKGQYGRFAERWFSRKGWSMDRKRMQGMSADDQRKDKPVALPDPESSNSGSGAVVKSMLNVDETLPNKDQASQDGLDKKYFKGSNVTDTLLPKLLRTTRLLLCSNSFYFSYDYDISRRWGSQETRNTDLPLFKSFDPTFFWNSFLTSRFISSGQHTFVLPIMQGFIGQRAFTVNVGSKDPTKTIAAVREAVDEVIELQENSSEAKDLKPAAKTRDFLLTLVSRRSIVRPGLRYLRRGIDHDGHTANSVETEQILSDPSWVSAATIYSFTQFRGSIPLYFSQSPYSFKPVPVLHHSFDTNHAAFTRHFSNIAKRYGNVQIALLVDKRGVEAAIGEAYMEHTKKLNEDNGISGTKIGIEWFDFHTECRGMKFENVSHLTDTLGPVLDSYSFTIEKDLCFTHTQSGVMRTNCMDCLDRTNVVQSACGSRALEQQLASEGIHLNLQTDASTQWFNTLWADNGDAISKQYSSTAALKGDYTRTRKRDYRGALNDFGLTLSRYYNNIVNDYFSQAAIDFLLGNVTDQVFEEFEADMMSGDPAMSMREVRQNAIDTSSRIVIADQSEELVGGWTLLCPREVNTVRTFPFEEAVLLLTDKALYAVRFDWNMEKVAGFERVDLRSVVSIERGVYITSTLAAAQMDEERNVGFVIKYRPGKGSLARVNTRSLTTTIEHGRQADEQGRGEKGSKENDQRDDEEATKTGKDKTGKEDLADNKVREPKDTKSSDLKILAFKALPTRSSFTAVNKDGSAAANISEREMVRNVCEEIFRAIGGMGSEELGDSLVKEEDIISLADAKKSTGLIEQLGHSLKKLVWA